MYFNALLSKEELPLDVMAANFGGLEEGHAASGKLDPGCVRTT